MIKVLEYTLLLTTHNIYSSTLETGPSNDSQAIIDSNNFFNRELKKHET